jgi:hypothetical protein
MKLAYYLQGEGMESVLAADILVSHAIFAHKAILTKLLILLTYLGRFALSVACMRST